MVQSRFTRLSLVSLACAGALFALFALFGLLALAAQASPVRAASFAASDTKPEAPADNPVIMVTNASDVENGNTSSVANLLANPGADGVSLREAVLASNNDAGPETITFSPGLSGAVISLGVGSFFPFLLGSGLTLNGDWNHDGVPDITLHGSAIGKGLSIWSDDNLVTGLKMTECDPCIDFPVPNGYSGASAIISGNVISGNVISNNILSARTAIMVGPLGWNQGASNITWQNFTFANNQLGIDGGFLFYAGADGLDNNRILSMTVVNNQVGDSIVFNPCDTNLPGSPPGYSDGGLVSNVVISGNTVGQIKLHAANMGNGNCHVRNVEIVGNSVNGGGITLVTAAEIHDTDGQATHDNSISSISIRNNLLVHTARGISLGAGGDEITYGGVGNVNNLMEHVEVLSNTILGVSNWRTGIWLNGGMTNGMAQVEGNVLRDILISGNRVEGAAGSSDNTGIHLVGGEINPDGANGHVFSNTVESITMTHNTIANLDRGIRIIGAAGTSDLGNHHNGVSGVLLHGNTISNTGLGIVVGNGFERSAEQGVAGLSDNWVSDLTITDNAVEGFREIGMWVYGARVEQDTVAVRNRVANLIVRNNRVTAISTSPEAKSLYVVGGLAANGNAAGLFQHGRKHLAHAQLNRWRAVRGRDCWRCGKRSA